MAVHRHLTPFALACALAAAAVGADPQWQLVGSEKFDEPGALGEWRLDGSAEVSVTKDGKLLVATQVSEFRGRRCRASVLWHKHRLEGDVRIEFDAKAEAKSRCIVFFNAQPHGGLKSVLDWRRPLAEYRDYATEERLELYSLGILRSDQKALNLRHLGSPESIATQKKRHATDPKKNPKEWKRLWDLFQEQTVLAEVKSPFADADKFYHVDIRVIGAEVSVRVDGKLLLDITDKARTGKPLRGGFLGFRNFRPTRVWYDNLRIYRRASEATPADVPGKTPTPRSGNERD